MERRRREVSACLHGDSGFVSCLMLALCCLVPDACLVMHVEADGGTVEGWESWFAAGNGWRISGA